MKRAALLLAVLTGIYSAAIALFGPFFVDPAAIRGGDLALYALPVLSLVAAALAVSAPGIAGTLLLVVAGGWLMLGAAPRSAD